MKESSMIGILPTDTIYGIVGSALDKAAVERIYRLRKRNLKKPMIVLISSVDDLARFGVVTTPAVKKILKNVWPGKVSVVLPCAAKKFEYLHRGTKTLAFRVPQLAWLRNLIKETGPLVAPSANIEGDPPAQTIRAARKYFGDKADFYIDVGRLASKPSTIIKIEKAKVSVVRKGAVAIRRGF